MPSVIGGEQKINDRIPMKLPKSTFVVHNTGLENTFATT